MNNLLPHKVKHYKNFADVVNKRYRQIRYGIQSCNPNADFDLAYMRKELVDYQSNDDAGALSQVNMNYRTWLPVQYEKDGLATFIDPSASSGAGYYNAGGYVGSNNLSVGLAYNNGQQNIIEVNAGGCITRINLNPAITINSNTSASFEFIQSTASTIWHIVHNMNMKPNVTIEDTVGNDIEGTIQYLDNNSLNIYFNTAVAGRAYLS